MAKLSMALAELVAHDAERLMEFEVEQPTAPSTATERRSAATAQRASHRLWETQGGSVDLCIPKVRLVFAGVSQTP
jgi:hypothetical protein